MEGQDIGQEAPQYPSHLLWRLAVTDDAEGDQWILKHAGDDSFYVEEIQEDGTTQGMWLPVFSGDE